MALVHAKPHTAILMAVDNFAFRIICSLPALVMGQTIGRWLDTSSRTSARAPHALTGCSIETIDGGVLIGFA
jgi:hypothetical protein